MVKTIFRYLLLISGILLCFGTIVSYWFEKYYIGFMLSVSMIVIVCLLGFQHFNSKKISMKSQFKEKRKRKGIHAKTKSSIIKGSKLYKKLYRGQGK